MDTNDFKIESILKDDRRFLVPIYQRKFEWGDNRLLSFWEDVSAKATELIFEESKFEHYMGALILSPINQGSQIGLTPIVQIVDGQQRLTTFQIFLAALREIARIYQFEDFIKDVDGYLFNKPKTKDLDPLTRYKLMPTKLDRNIFCDIVDLTYEENKKKYNHLYWGNRIPKNCPFPAYRAYYLFYRLIHEFVKKGPEGDAAIDFDSELNNNVIKASDFSNEEMRLVALFNSILDRLKLVVISLGENDDAQVIFETLNSKGKPLQAIDLVKNNIFHRASQRNTAIDVEQIYNQFWHPLDDHWWRSPAPNARPRRSRIDHFLANVLAAETGNKISVSELYAEYREFAVPNGVPKFQQVEDELKHIEKYIPIYETLEGHSEEPDDTLAWLGKKLAIWQVTTVFPVVFQLGVADIDFDEKKKLAELIYSYIVRRALCNLTTKNLNKVFLSIVSYFIRQGVSVDSFRSFFNNKNGDSIRFPSDDEFKLGIQINNAYAIDPKPRLRDILWELEIASRSNLAESIDPPPNLTIEHVLPQSWGTEWPFEDGTVTKVDFVPHLLDESPQAFNRSLSIHTLGNLTLLTNRLNSSAQNIKFDLKKTKYFEHSSLFLNKWFINQDRWTEAEIKERCINFSELAVNIWTGLEE